MSPSGLPFSKLHGAHNDFLFVSVSALSRFCPETLAKQSNLSSLAISVCDRTGGPGADGLVIWDSEPSSGDLENPSVMKVSFLILNSDGSLALLCGNALRCFALHLVREKLWDGRAPLSVFRFVTPGMRSSPDVPAALLLSAAPFAKLIHVSPSPSLIGGEATVAFERERAIESGLAAPWASLLLARLGLGDRGKTTSNEDEVAWVSLSNEHLVLLSPTFAQFSEENFATFGRKAQTLAPGVCGKSVEPNVGMLWRDGTSCWQLRVFERGAGLTACCGSGAVAARCALEVLGQASADHLWTALEMSGGQIFAGGVDAQPGMRTLRGPAQLVATGEMFPVNSDSA